MTEAERKAIEEYERRQSFLEPFRRITDEWSVETQHQFQNKIRDLDLVAEGDLESTWNVKVLAKDTGTVVAEFGFDSYGRYHDMRRLNKSEFVPASGMESWVKSKIDKGQIKYSTLEQRLGVRFSDQRVIHDLTYRFARAPFHKRRRRQWYNKNKEASIHDLYDQLYEAGRAIVRESMKTSLQDTRAVVS